VIWLEDRQFLQSWHLKKADGKTIGLFRCACSRAVPVKTESWNRSIHLFLRIILRKTATHFCWKCSNRANAPGQFALFFGRRWGSALGSGFATLDVAIAAFFVAFRFGNALDGDDLFTVSRIEDRDALR